MRFFSTPTGNQNHTTMRFFSTPTRNQNHTMSTMRFFSTPTGNQNSFEDVSTKATLNALKENIRSFAKSAKKGAKSTANGASQAGSMIRKKSEDVVKTTVSDSTGVIGDRPLYKYPHPPYTDLSKH